MLYNSSSYYSYTMKKLETFEMEILAPAGNFAMLRAAINAGCNSVYFGISDFNMRASAAKNFSREDLPKIVALCKKNDVRTYLTVNTLLYDDEMDRMETVVTAAEKAGITAIIAADMATVMFAQSKRMEVHISTQVSVSNSRSVEFYSKYADRIVLARELNLEKIREIATNIKKNNIRGPHGELLQLEVFAHGALCVAVSGRCAMSMFCYERSANQGKCTHICRRAYKVTDLETGQELEIDNNYVMSAADLCTVGFLPEVIKTGARTLKIEGRGRTPEYVDTVVRTYKEALKSIETGTYSKKKVEKWKNDLKTVFNRGFCDGFYFDRKPNEWSGIDGSKATEKRVQLGKITNYFKKSNIAEIELKTPNSIEIGSKLIITGPTTGIVRTNIEEIRKDDNPVKEASKGDTVSFPVKDLVRRGDDAYLLVQDNE